MSNIGKLAINIPQKLNVEVQTYESFQRLIIKNTTALKAINLPLSFKIEIAANSLSVNGSADKEMWGTVRQNLQQLVTGLTTGFTKTLQISGIGYKSAYVAASKKLILALGYTHDIEVVVPAEIEATCPNATTIILNSHSYGQLTAFAHKIEALRPGRKDRYKKKGVHVL